MHTVLSIGGLIPGPIFAEHSFAILVLAGSSHLRQLIQAKDSALSEVTKELRAVKAAKSLVEVEKEQVEAEKQQVMAEKEEVEAEKLRLATTDLLTGLNNRSVFVQHLEREISDTRRTGVGFAVLALDMDNFMQVVDSFSHAASDEVLVEAAQRLRICLRDSDPLARPGGDEFLILLPAFKDPVKVGRKAREILDELRRPFIVQGREIVLTASMGIAFHPADGVDAGTLLRNADAALAQAKKTGRDRFHLFSEELNRGALERLEMQGDLRHATEENAFHLAYQPRVDLKTGKPVGMEALIRWNHALHGAIAPLKFIPLAEESGLIVPIGQWVLRQATEWTQRQFSEEGKRLRVSVNLSARQFREPDLVQKVTQILESSGLNPEDLELEITESMLMEDEKTAEEQLHKLKALGISLAIDDFGTGYSSLARLRHFPVDILKIDRAFVMVLDQPNAEKDRSVAAAMIVLGHELGMRIVAEGVETVEQLEILRELGCDEVQGYFYAKPMLEEAFLDYIGKAS